MTAWPEIPLSEIAAPISRLVQVEPGRDYRTIGVKWWGEGAYERETIDGSRTAAKTLSIVRAGDLIINKIWVRHGSTAIATKSVDGCAASNEFPTFKLDEDKIVDRWIHWQTKTKRFWSKCDALSKGTSGKNRIKPEQFLTIRIPLPPLPEQRRIVGRIEELAAQIQEARALRENATAETNALAPSAAERCFQDLSKRHGAQPLQNLCHTITDGDHNTPQFSDDGVRFIFVGNVSSGYLHFQSTKCVSRNYFSTLKPQRLPEVGDILYSAVGATLGIPAVVDSPEPFCFQRHVAILKPDRQKADSKFLWHMLRSRTVFAKAWASTTGSAQPTIPLRAIRELPIPAAPLAEQRRIVAELNGLQTQVDALQKLQNDTAAELDALLPSILDKAFKGEL
jgi:type I restriction enzyme S subunit